ncbi:MAG: hypothetical protein RLZZ303_1060 [Candidatus Hydrogenedentota bacterium]
MLNHDDRDGGPVWAFWPAVAALVAAVLIGGLGLWGVQPPEPKPRTAPLDEFSAFRAHSHILEMCVETHPTGSQAALRVRQYIESAVRAAGYEPELHQAIVPRQTNRSPFQLSYIENVMVRIPGTNPTGAFLLMAHYDSVPYGLGASDDAAGCAAMLETLRALKHHQPPKNDLIFLFTDGEEAGLLGPRAFMTHPYYEDVKAVLNFEARGYYGPSLMFELSDDNGWLIEQVALAATDPVASSVMFDVAGRMPTTTDYEVLKRAGMPGMGLAYVGGIEYYHTPNDSPEKISLASLQHHGEYGLPLALHFGDIDLSSVRAPNSVYFDVIGYGLVRYPQKWIPLFTALAFLAFGGAVLLGLYRDSISVGGMLVSVLAHLTTILVAALIVGGIVYAAIELHQEYLVYRTYPYFFGFCALTLCLYAITLRMLSRRLSTSSIAAGGFALWVPVLLATAEYAPGGTYIPTWPLIGASLGLAVLCGLGHRLPAGAAPGITLLGALPALLIVTPLMYLSLISVTVVPSPFWMANFVLLLTALSPLLVTAVRHSGLILPAGALSVALPLLVYALMGASFTKDTPKMNHLCYGMNCSTGEAYWLSADDELDEWLRHFFQSEDERGTVDDFIPGMQAEFRRAVAPPSDVPHSEVAVLSDNRTAGARELVLRVSSPRKAARLDIALAPEVDVYEASLNGIGLGDAKKEKRREEGQPWRVRYQGLSYDGVELRLVLPADVPVRMLVREESFGIPPIPGINVPPRPEHMITENNVKGFWKRGSQHFRSNVLYTVKTFDL